ncbi:hypothetical protein Ais01nite_19910 [Asanoa ishikariensis]|uniref:Clp R domain-containing protein n=1 Tax=Asanoa ishikariensis TaxID=137265 RepID=A0A1H3UAS0_9ACTN|nr:hypothetical protein [Asanoa ishikariensis]GIF63956.1 hypothetical protein Ais01nite_19910 [Asanoa ishikariensis]SDZ59496.1 hypothetical protein SAMN05421684_6882 [Asanoa ishikariensis]
MSGEWTDAALRVLGVARGYAAGRRDWLITDLDVLRALVEADATCPWLLGQAGFDLAALNTRLVEHTNRLPHRSSNGEMPMPNATVTRILAGAQEGARRAGAPASHSTDLLEAVAAVNEGAAHFMLAEGGGRLEDVRADRAPRPVTPRRAVDQPQPVRQPMSGSLVGTGALVGFAAIGTTLRGLLRFANQQVTLLAFLPGVIALVGVRAFTARAAQVPYTVRLNRWPGDVTLPEDFNPATRGAWRMTAVRLFPSVVLLVLGTLLLAPFLIRQAALSTAILPALSHNPGVAIREGGPGRIALNAFLTYGLIDLVKIWCGIAFWFCAAPKYEQVAESRTELKDAARSGSKLLAGTVRVALAPLQGILWLFKPIDEVALWLGANVLVASGGVTVAVCGIACLTVFSWW